MQRRAVLLFATLCALPSADGGISKPRPGARPIDDVIARTESLRMNVAEKPAAQTRQAIEKKVKDIIVEQLGVKPQQVVPAAKFIEDLGADSLDTVELVMAFEEEFAIEIPDEAAEKMATVGSVVKYIEAQAGKKPKK